jgi:hypothetical protein
MKLQVKQAGGKHELTVESQKEFLQLYNRGVIAGDDLVLRGERWVRAQDLPWIHGMRMETRRDNKRLLWITLAMMVLGLLGVIWIQSHAGTVARKSGATQEEGESRLPPGAVHAVPPR